MGARWEEPPATERHLLAEVRTLVLAVLLVLLAAGLAGGLS